MKKLFALLVLAALLCACTAQPPAVSPSEAPTAAAGTEAATEAEQELSTLSVDTVAFYHPGSDRAEYVPIQTLQDEALLYYSRAQEAYLIERSPETIKLRQIYPYVEYALQHGYHAFAFADDAGLKDVICYTGAFIYLYPFDQGDVMAASVGFVETANGSVPRTYVCIEDRDSRENAGEKFAEAFAAAQELVASVPAEYDEYETARYLYEYLTDNVAYDYRYENYYQTDWHLLYDTLIGHKTVCTGFADTLYYLFNLAGIDCQIVYGAADNGSGEMVSHEWNVATLGGHSYYFDATYDAAKVYTVASGFFAVSESGLNAKLQHIPSLYQYAPDAAQNLGVPDWWNDTPEGAIKSFLLLKEYAAYPQMLPFLLGLYDDTTTLVRTDADGYGTYSISYEAFAERMRAYVSDICLRKQFLTGRFADDDGLLACYTGLNGETGYRFVQLYSQQGNQYTAQIESANDRYTAVFTLSEENGRWRVDGFRLEK